MVNTNRNMKFELNDYHRNVSDQEFILDVQETAKRLGKDTLTGEEYSLHGKYHSSTLTRRFGSWKKVLEKCSLETQGHNFKYDFSDEDVVIDLKRVAEITGTETPTAREYNSHGRYYSTTLIRRYGTWSNILELAGMKANLNRNFSDEQMFEEIERIWVVLGRQPTTTDIKKGISKYSLNSYARRFGGWRNALQAFVDYINSDGKQEEIANVSKQKSITTFSENKDICDVYHKTSRDINLRMRFKVLQRDNFKCCTCGASPAKDPSVELHIDHIMPWSKGGETEIDNLQTLCSKCNLGKSDLT